MKTTKDKTTEKESVTNVATATSATHSVVTTHPISGDHMLYVLGAGAAQGGVGKTTIMVEIANWLKNQGKITTKIDLDESVKKRGSFQSFFPDVIKAPLSDNVGLNTLLQAVGWEPRIVLVDSAASTTAQTIDWFDQVYPVLNRRGHRFLVVGVVTPDETTVDAFLAYGEVLQYRANYLVVQNETIYKAPSAWPKHPKTARFTELFNPGLITMPYRDSELQRLLRQHSLTLEQVAHGTHEVEVLHDSMYQILAEILLEQITTQLNSVKKLFL